jgi:catechol 2,3-dioxygenase-like lactoylglutathione lyase family enzyme
MIGYVTLGTNDLPRAAAFYDQLFAEIGVKRLMEADRYMFWGIDMSKPALSIIKPYDGKPATVGNGVMVGLTVNTTAQVDALHARAIALGGKDEGAPGPRGTGGFYCGYFRDLDGNKLLAFTVGAP